jgi:hypothetical protein
MIKMNEIKQLQRESNKGYKYIKNFVDDYCKSDKDKIEFFKNLNLYLEAEIELEKLCNQ